MRILYTGITGLLGYSLQNIPIDGTKIFGIYYPGRHLKKPLNADIHAINVTNFDAMENVFKLANPDVVVHAAAVGSVDFAEQNREFSKNVNVGGTEIVSKLCEKWKSRLVYISSNAVFDGTSPLYRETDETNPINYYGHLKVDAENVVMKSNIRWTIVRPILMYGWPYPGERGNLVTTWVEQLREGKNINVVDNVYSKPLCSISCAEAVYAVIEKNADGIFHVAGNDHVSLYEFALITADVFGLESKLINPVPDTFFDYLVPRPRDTSFDTTKIECELGVKPLSLKEGLRRMKDNEKTYNFKG